MFLQNSKFGYFSWYVEEISRGIDKCYSISSKMKTMNKKIIWVIGLPLIIYGFLMILGFIYVEIATNPDSNFNTEYAAKYSKEQFQKMELEVSYDYLISKMGEPLKKDTIEYTQKYLYLNFPNGANFIEGRNSINLNGEIDSMRYSLISMNIKGEITDISTNYKLGGIAKEELKKYSKEKLIKEFGHLQKVMICNCECEVLSYSKLIKGPYRGKKPVIHLRNILLKDNKVVGKVSQEGNPYNPYIGTCEIQEN